MDDKSEEYDRIVVDLRAICEGERDFLANMANCAAILFQVLSDINWAGFYLSKGPDLVLGPFQGKPACTRIGPGRGVCGTAAAKRVTIVVPDVHEFPGHIACDAASRSEVVVPLIIGGRFVGVLDLDSPHTDRFNALDASRLESIAQLLIDASDFGGDDSI